jgi:DUF4097 and DUF4098 domain-containing protein YvlB
MWVREHKPNIKENETMDENRMGILKMVSEGKITPEEALELLKAIESKQIATQSDDEALIRLSAQDYKDDDEPVEGEGERKKRPRFLIIQVTEGGKKKVNVKIPLKLARLAMRFIPKSAQAHMKAEGVEFDINELLSGLEEIGAGEELVNVVDDDKGEVVRIFCC